MWLQLWEEKVNPKLRQLTIHHKKPRSLGGHSDNRNLSFVPKYLHRSWHNLFSNYTPETIASIINEKWLDPDYEFVVRKKERR